MGCSEISFSRWADLIFRSKRTSSYIACHSCPFVDHDMFHIMAEPTVSAISVIFDNVEQEEILTMTLQHLNTGSRQRWSLFGTS